MELGKRIKELRKTLNWNQDELAEKMFVSRQTISSWENDKSYPDIQSVLLLSDLFHVSVDQLLKGDVEKMTLEKNLMKALHRVFWYNGLLEQEGDEWVDFKIEGQDIPFSRPEFSKDSPILVLIERMKNTVTFSLSDAVIIEPSFDFGKEHNVIWMILVSMFGDYGTSPRGGWIERCEECADFLKQVVEIDENTL